MRTPSWLVVVPLFVVVWLMALVSAGWPGAVAHATDGPRTRDAHHAVMLSQDNDDESDDDDDDEDDDDDDDNADDDDDDDDDDNADEDDDDDDDNADEDDDDDDDDDNDDDDDDDDDDNDDDDNDESDDDDDDDNDNRGDVNVVPVPGPVSPPAGASVSAVDEVSQCLANGGTLVYQGPEAGIVVTSYQDNLNVTLTRIDPASQPPPPGAIVSSYIFRMSAAPCGGAPYSVLPSEVNLAVSYSEVLAAGRDETRLALMYFDGVTWAVAPKLYRDPDNNHVSASVTGLGVYALVQQ